MPRGKQRDVHAIERDGFTIPANLFFARPIRAAAHDGKRFGGCEYSAMAAARMIGMAVGYDGARYRFMRIDKKAARLAIKPFGAGFDPIANWDRRRRNHASQYGNVGTLVPT